jgi:hypothetical protein
MLEFDARESNRTVSLWAIRPVSESATPPRYEYFVPISCAAPKSRPSPSGHLLPRLKLLLSIVPKKRHSLTRSSSQLLCLRNHLLISTMLSFSKLFPAIAGLTFLSRGFPLNRSLTEEAFPKSLISPPFIHYFFFKAVTASYIPTSCHSLLAKDVSFVFSRHLSCLLKSRTVHETASNLTSL